MPTSSQLRRNVCSRDATERCATVLKEAHQGLIRKRGREDKELCKSTVADALSTSVGLASKKPGEDAKKSAIVCWLKQRCFIEKHTSGVSVLKSDVLVPSTKDQSDDPQIEEAQRCQWGSHD